MSNFTCFLCKKDIIDSPKGYITGCPHYPLKSKGIDNFLGGFDKKKPHDVPDVIFDLLGIKKQRR